MNNANYEKKIGLAIASTLELIMLEDLEPTAMLDKIIEVEPLLVSLRDDISGNLDFSGDIQERMAATSTYIATSINIKNGLLEEPSLSIGMLNSMKQILKSAFGCYVVTVSDMITEAITSNKIDTNDMETLNGMMDELGQMMDALPEGSLNQYQFRHLYSDLGIDRSFEDVDEDELPEGMTREDVLREYQEKLDVSMFHRLSKDEISKIVEWNMSKSVTEDFEDIDEMEWEEE